MSVIVHNSDLKLRVTTKFKTDNIDPESPAVEYYIHDDASPINISTPDSPISTVSISNYSTAFIEATGAQGTSSFVVKDALIATENDVSTLTFTSSNITDSSNAPVSVEGGTPLSKLYTFDITQNAEGVLTGTESPEYKVGWDYTGETFDGCGDIVGCVYTPGNLSGNTGEPWYKEHIWMLIIVVICLLGLAYYFMTRPKEEPSPDTPSLVPGQVPQLIDEKDDYF